MKEIIFIYYTDRLKQLKVGLAAFRENVLSLRQRKQSETSKKKSTILL